MRQKKKPRHNNALRIIVALGVTAGAVCMLASGKGNTAVCAADVTEPESTAELVIYSPAPVGGTTPAVIETVDEETEQAEAAEPVETEPPVPEVDEAELEMLACAIYAEAGGNACSDLCRYYVGDVILNRVADERFPDSVEGVLTQEGQYGRFYWTGIVWPERAQYDGETDAVQRAYDTARSLLSGEHSELYGVGYIWQAEFKQGTDVIYLDGIYFGR